MNRTCPLQIVREESNLRTELDSRHSSEPVCSQDPGPELRNGTWTPPGGEDGRAGPGTPLSQQQINQTHCNRMAESAFTDSDSTQQIPGPPL
jgi:hypothetical protein